MAASGMGESRRWTNCSTALQPVSLCVRVHTDTSAPCRALCLWSPITRRHVSLLCATVVPLPAVLPPFLYVLMQGLSTAVLEVSWHCETVLLYFHNVLFSFQSLTATPNQAPLRSIKPRISSLLRHKNYQYVVFNSQMSPKLSFQLTFWTFKSVFEGRFFEGDTCRNFFFLLDVFLGEVSPVQKCPPVYGNSSPPSNSTGSGGCSFSSGSLQDP